MSDSSANPSPSPRALAEATVQPRPKWLRALGHDDPPARFEAAGEAWRRLHIYKHDAFAATALYVHVDDPTQHVVGKFSRRQSAFGIPFAWLGQWFHHREQEVYRRMQGIPGELPGGGVPEALGGITVDGHVWPSAAARRYVEGQPLGDGGVADNAFFPALRELILRFHERGVAVVDLHKCDNILVGDDGRPHLIDFQISLIASQTAWRVIDPRAWWLPSAKRADLYHLMKNWRRHRPDQLTPEEADLDRYRPVSIRLWRKLIRPVHVGRRRLFVALGFRTGKGDPSTEVAPDVRPPETPPGREPTKHVAAKAAPSLTPSSPTSPKLPA